MIIIEIKTSRIIEFADYIIDKGISGLEPVKKFTSFNKKSKFLNELPDSVRNTFNIGCSPNKHIAFIYGMDYCDVIPDYIIDDDKVNLIVNSDPNFDINNIKIGISITDIANHIKNIQLQDLNINETQYQILMTYGMRHIIEQKFRNSDVRKDEINNKLVRIINSIRVELNKAEHICSSNTH